MYFALAASMFTVSLEKCQKPFKLGRCKSEEHKLGYQIEKLLLYNHEQPGV